MLTGNLSRSGHHVRRNVKVERDTAMVLVDPGAAGIRLQGSFLADIKTVLPSMVGGTVMVLSGPMLSRASLAEDKALELWPNSLVSDTKLSSAKHNVAPEKRQHADTKGAVALKRKVGAEHCISVLLSDSISSKPSPHLVVNITRGV